MDSDLRSVPDQKW